MRRGITYEEVASAARQLELAGRQATVDGVRQITGRGSRTTLNMHLKAYRASRAQPKPGQELPPVLSVALSKVLEETRGVAQAELQKAITEADQRVERANQLAAQASLKADAAERERAVTQARNDELNKLVARQSDVIGRLQDEVASLRARLQAQSDLSVKITDSHMKLSAQIQLLVSMLDESGRASRGWLAELHKGLAQQLDRAVSGLTVDMKSANGELRGLVGALAKQSNSQQSAMANLSRHLARMAVGGRARKSKAASALRRK